jgi:2-polyprenyl-3-methyl-5-hydroxy-6-metoxy-1,4-benzoquinol methylase
VLNEVPELYDRVRPTYQDKLFADLVTITAMDKGSSVLQVGCATGQATRSVAALGCRIRDVDVDHAAPADPILPEPPRVGVVLNFEHSAVDHTTACPQKALDVPPVYRCAAIEPVLVAERLAR